MAMPFTKGYTAADVRAIPDDGNRYETVHGELLVTPAPGGHHQLVLNRLNVELVNYLRRHGREETLFSPSDISWAESVLVQPDLFVADLDAWKRSGQWSDIQTLHLAIEILSPSSVRADRFTKRRLYQAHVATYWMVNPGAKLVEVWHPDDQRPTVERERLAWRHPALQADCVIDLEALFTI